MKKIFNILTFALLALLVATSCAGSNEEVRLPMGENEGVLALNFNYGATKTTTAEEQSYVLRIFRYTGETNQESGEPIKELVRKFTAKSDVPEYIWLVNGNYCATVEVGNKEITTSFDQRFFYGAEDFEITSGKISNVEVKCNMCNAVVATEFDTTVAEKFSKEYYVYVSIADNFDLAAAKSGEVASLKYTDNRQGYFLLPEGCTTLSWYF
jgi:hypothetical protein